MPYRDAHITQFKDLLVQYTSPQSGFYDLAVLKLLTQALSNLVTQHPSNQSRIWNEFGDQLPRLIAYPDLDIVHTALIFVRNLSSSGSIRLLSRRPVLIALLDLFIRLESTDEDDDAVFHLACVCCCLDCTISDLISFVIISSIFEAEDVDAIWELLEYVEDISIFRC